MKTLAERRREALIEALTDTCGHRNNAAKLLGVASKTVYNALLRDPALAAMFPTPPARAGRGTIGREQAVSTA